jgi:hypothetical protein
MQEFSLNTKNVQADLKLYHKYTLIDGYSGSGKSLFIREVRSAIDIGSSNLRSSLPCYVINSQAELGFMKLVLDRGELAIFIADEHIGYKVIEAAKDKEAYCIVVSRKKYPDIDAHKSVYEASRDEKGKTLIKLKGRDEYIEV